MGTVQPRLGTFDTAMVVVSLVIGIGIFRTPAMVASASGTPALFFTAWLLGGLVSLAGALTFAEIGSRSPHAGAYYKVVADAYHPVLGFMLNWSYVLMQGAGAAGVVIPQRRAAEVTPAVCRASAGAVEHLAIARVRNLADFLGEAKRGGAWVYGADAAATRLYTDVEWTGPAVLVLGSEGRGLRPRVREACDDLIRLPLHGSVDSLNVSAAAAVLLYEAVRSRAEAARGT